MPMLGNIIEDGFILPSQERITIVNTTALIFKEIELSFTISAALVMNFTEETEESSDKEANY